MAAWGKACRVAVRAGAASFRQQGLPGAESHLSNGLACSVSQQTRGMASGGHHGREITYEGLTLHAPATWHTYVGKGMCGIMWFWIFYRAYHDGETFLFGHAPHFEHELQQEGHPEATEGH
ncbi:hypothetical protein ABBQ32_001390 [Trebouxia sp. C0010 RCD-2024]